MSEDSYLCQSEAEVVRLLQITDPHLFSDEKTDLLGINTTDSFQAVIEEICDSSFDYDLILATGDLVQDHNREAYHHFAQMVKPLKKPLFWIEGNHDIQPQMTHSLAIYEQIQPYKHILAGKFWQIILLDSHLENIPAGELSPTQLEFLQRSLQSNPDRYTLIVLHHNILPTNSAWLDQHSLHNSEELAEILFPFKQVKALLHGHIHQEVDAIWKGYRVFATPSTCIQFKPNCDTFTLDNQPQGWRELTLLPNGQIETQVKRLKTAHFLPNFHSNGY